MFFPCITDIFITITTAASITSFQFWHFISSSCGRDLEYLDCVSQCRLLFLLLLLLCNFGTLLAHLVAGLWKIRTCLLHAWLKFLDAWEKPLVLLCVLLQDIFVCEASKNSDGGILFGFHFSFQLFLLLKCISCSVFNPLLDDTPLPINEASSSVLVATYSNGSLQNGKGAIGGGKPAMNGEVEKGLLTLISSDNPGLQVSLYLSNDKSNIN